MNILPLSYCSVLGVLWYHLPLHFIAYAILFKHPLRSMCMLSIQWSFLCVELLENESSLLGSPNIKPIMVKFFLM